MRHCRLTTSVRIQRWYGGSTRCGSRNHLQTILHLRRVVTLQIVLEQFCALNCKVSNLQTCLPCRVRISRVRLTTTAGFDARFVEFGLSLLDNNKSTVHWCTNLVLHIIYGQIKPRFRSLLWLDLQFRRDFCSIGSAVSVGWWTQNYQMLVYTIL